MAQFVFVHFVCITAFAEHQRENEDRSDWSESVWRGGLQGAEEGRPHHRWSLYHPRQRWQGRPFRSEVNMTPCIISLMTENTENRAAHFLLLMPTCGETCVCAIICTSGQ